ncbi:Hypothetical protein R9X50_00318900 [Acrodontium crateriforme]|uniref:Uncharacterized protein n=1 Tax=Acrodontium crateriforme TaxID=150365 RepID=A0AAQ3M8K4_9PEZI|nr:Hypothetical protein R9X50_00318900 [Acrodontium crateriforme]
MADLEPIMRSVSSTSVVSNPTPKRSLPGGSLSSISRLEQSAEQLSLGGSDIADEIRKMNDEQKARSRSASQTSTQTHDNNAATQSGTASNILETVRSRASSHTTSIVDVNGAARWGGYSPSGYISSPVGSSKSRESWSMVQAPRKASVSGSSRLAQMVEPLHEGRPLDSPLTASFPDSIHTPSRQPSDASRSSRKSLEKMANEYKQASEKPPYSPLESGHGQVVEGMEKTDVHPLQRDETDNAKVPSGVKHGDVGQGTNLSSKAEEDSEKSKHEVVMQQHNETYNALERRVGSIDTFQEAEIAFKDFDGTHFSPMLEEFSASQLDELGGSDEVKKLAARKSSGRLSLGAGSVLSAGGGPRPTSYMSPPPGSNMVYYPAPVPRMLNLPKRLTQLPAATVQSQRRSQVLSSMPMDSAPWHADAVSPSEDATDRRRSTAWSPGGTGGSAFSPRGSTFSPMQSVLSDGSGSHTEHPQPRGMLNERMSIANFNNLPPQLRASVYFEHQSVAQNVKVEHASAVATLDSILAASATAPVNAFMDHPYAGDVRKTVYAAAKPARKSTNTLASGPEPTKRRRSSSAANVLRRRTTGESLEDILESRDGKTPLRRRSQMSMGDELEYDRTTPGTEADFSTGLMSSAHNHAESHVAGGPRRTSQMRDADQIEADFKAQDDDDDVDVDEGEASFVQPATLLAELQVRKAQQKSRNRTAVSAFPQGMHSTLLQLDAVQEINKKKRQNQRINLAWEDQNQHGLRRDDDEDDVPLGMLFPGKDGAATRRTNDARDWDRPLGLMERRQLEDNEPLSSRRNRLKGVTPVLDRRVYNEMQAQQPAVEGEEDDENADESLGNRQQRLKRKSILDSAIADIATPLDGDKRKSGFTDEVLSQFGGLEAAAAAGDGKATPDLENETLGERRARLQREREAAGDADGLTASRPALRSSTSLSNLLATNPAGPRRTSARDHQPARGTLLHASAEAQSRHKQQLYNTNVRSSTFAIERPLVDGRINQHQPSTGFLGGYQSSTAANGGFAAGRYNNGAGGLMEADPQQAPMFSVGGTNGMFASPTAAIGMGTNTSYANAMGFNPMMMMMPQQHWQQPMVNPMAYQTFNGGHMSMIPGMPGMMAFAGNGSMPSANTTYGAAAMRMGGPVDDGLNNKQRAMIDQWRMGVAQ